MPAQAVLGTGAPARGGLKLAGAIALVLAAAMLAFRAELVERRGALIAGARALTGFLRSLGLLLFGVDNLYSSESWRARAARAPRSLRHAIKPEVEHVL